MSFLKVLVNSLICSISTETRLGARAWAMLRVAQTTAMQVFTKQTSYTEVTIV